MDYSNDDTYRFYTEPYDRHHNNGDGYYPDALIQDVDSAEPGWHEPPVVSEPAPPNEFDVYLRRMLMLGLAIMVWGVIAAATTFLVLSYLVSRD